MKKALSTLLVVAVLLSLAAPLAFAGTVTATPAVPRIKVGETIKLTPADYPSPPTNPDGLLYWDLKDLAGNTIFVGFTPVTPVDVDKLVVGIGAISDNSTQVILGNDGSMIITGRAPGSVIITVESVDGSVINPDGTYTYTALWKAEYPLEIYEDDPVPGTPGEGLLEILKSWWFDLKWTWDYQIHPFFKYIYFNSWNWFVNAWDLLISSIVNLFSGLFS